MKKIIIFWFKRTLTRKTNNWVSDSSAFSLIRSPPEWNLSFINFNPSNDAVSSVTSIIVGHSKHQILLLPAREIDKTTSYTAQLFVQISIVGTHPTLKSDYALSARKEALLRRLQNSNYSSRVPTSHFQSLMISLKFNWNGAKTKRFLAPPCLANSQFFENLPGCWKFIKRGESSFSFTLNKTFTPPSAQLTIKYCSHSPKSFATV